MILYKYINIQYEIFLTEFVYSKTTSFYIKKYFFLKIFFLIRLKTEITELNSVKKFRFQYYSVRFSIFKKIQKKIRLFRFCTRITRTTRMPTPILEYGRAGISYTHNLIPFEFSLVGTEFLQELGILGNLFDCIYQGNVNLDLSKGL